MPLGQRGRQVSEPSSGDAPMFACEPVALNKEQQRVRDILANLQTDVHRLAAMYESCLLVLKCPGNDERLNLAAHAVREIVAHLPRAINGHWDRERLLGNINKLRDAFGKLGPSIGQGERLPSAVAPDPKVKEFLDSFGKFSLWFQDNGFQRRTDSTNMFRSLMPAAPPGVQEGLGKTWAAAYGFFSGIAHHDSRAPPDVDEFRTHLAEIEKCIMAVKPPEAIDDLRELDAIVEKGESS